MVTTKGLKKEDVLAALYNASRPQGLGFLHYDPTPMEPEQAADLLKQGAYFDYVKGRVLKVNLSNDDGFDERGYDRDNGQGAAERVIEALRRAGPQAEEIVGQHAKGVHEGALRTLDAAALKPESTFHRDGDFAVLELGVGELREPLLKAVEKAQRKEKP